MNKDIFRNYAPFDLSHVSRFGVRDRGAVLLDEHGNTRKPLLPLGDFESVWWNGKSGDECESAYVVTFPQGEHGAAAKRLARRILRGCANGRDLARLERAAK